MSLLLVILFAAGAPVPPQPAPMVVVSPPVLERTLTWPNSPSPGCSNRLYIVSGTVTTSTNIGPTNVVRVVTPVVPRTFYFVRAEFNGAEAQPANTVGIPPKPVLDICQSIDGQQTVLVSYTNKPPGQVGLFYTQQREDYSP